MTEQEIALTKVCVACVCFKEGNMEKARKIAQDVFERKQMTRHKNEAGRVAKSQNTRGRLRPQNKEPGNKKNKNKQRIRK